MWNRIMTFHHLLQWGFLLQHAKLRNCPVLVSVWLFPFCLKADWRLVLVLFFLYHTKHVTISVWFVLYHTKLLTVSVWFFLYHTKLLTVSVWFFLYHTKLLTVSVWFFLYHTKLLTVSVWFFLYHTKELAACFSVVLFIPAHKTVDCFIWCDCFYTIKSWWTVVMVGCTFFSI